MFNIFGIKKQPIHTVPETVIYKEDVYLTPDAKLVIHTLYRGKSPHDPNNGTKNLSTNDDNVANAFLKDCEYLGEL